MSKNEFTEYQKSVISGYYRNLDTIMLGKLSEMVSELYLADAQAAENAGAAVRSQASRAESRDLLDPKQDRLWQRVHKAMLKLNIPPAIIDHIMDKRDVKILAKNLQDWVARASRP